MKESIAGTNERLVDEQSPSVIPAQIPTQIEFYPKVKGLVSHRAAIIPLACFWPFNCIREARQFTVASAYGSRWIVVAALELKSAWKDDFQH